MTITIEQTKVNRYYIFVEMDEFMPGYRVGVAKMYDEYRAGYPITENFYATREKAMRRFRDLKRRYAYET